MPQTALLVDQLKKSLQEAGITYAVVANQLGLSEGSVKRLGRGRAGRAGGFPRQRRGSTGRVRFARVPGLRVYSWSRRRADSPALHARPWRSPGTEGHR